MTLLAGRPSAPPPRSAAAPTRSTFVPSRPLGKFAPPLPAARPLAAKIGASKAAAPSASSRLVRAVAGQTQYAAQDPFAPIAGSDLLQSRPLRELMFQGQFNQDFQALKSAGLLPKGAKEPPLAFPLQGLGAQRDLSYETGTSDAGNARVHISPAVLYEATQNGGFLPSQAWARETPIHELAHALQKPSVLKNKPLREGGAQAFADNAAVRTLGPLAINDTNYSGYVRNVRSKLGPKFYLRGQFG